MFTLSNRAQKAAKLMHEKGLSAPIAATKVVNGEGINFQPDVRRIRSSICSELAQHKSSKPMQNEQADDDAWMPSEQQVALEAFNNSRSRGGDPKD